MLVVEESGDGKALAKAQRAALFPEVACSYRRHSAGDQVIQRKEPAVAASIREISGAAFKLDERNGASTNCVTLKPSAIFSAETADQVKIDSYVGQAVRLPPGNEDRR